jgi:arginine exporter protein ArgO
MVVPGFGGVARAYGALLGLTLLNPATVIYFAALVLGHSATSASGIAAALFVVAVFAASASWQLLLAVGGSALGRYLAGPRGRRATAAVSVVLIVALAARTFVG